LLIITRRKLFPITQVAVVEEDSFRCRTPDSRYESGMIDSLTGDALGLIIVVCILVGRLDFEISLKLKRMIGLSVSKYLDINILIFYVERPIHNYANSAVGNKYKS
jgi:hypothetical protein